MLNKYFFNQTKRYQYITALVIVLIVACVGTYLLTNSHAAEPYVSTTADSGTLNGGATTQPCTGASNGKCVVFESSSSGPTYYVSPTGSNSNSGTSSSSPWQTVAKVNDTCFQPGTTIVFEGGQTFSDTYLSPDASCDGTVAQPITYSSYGTGQAILADGVWLSGAVHDLVFNNLAITGANSNFSTCDPSDSGCTGTYDITLNDLYIHNTNLTGVNTNSVDHNWLIENSTIEYTGDSGILTSYSPDMTITHNTIAYTGQLYGTTYDYGTHGIYAKGPNETISYNDISYDTGGQAVSIRAHGAQIYGNTIHDTPIAFSFFDYDTSAPPQGTSYIYNNRVWNIADYIFYYGNQADPQGNSPSVSLVFANNTFVLSGATAADGTAVNLNDVPSTASITFANNITTGSYVDEYNGCSTCSEYNNDWYGGSSYIPSGSKDLFVNPNLSAAPVFSLSAGSPLINAGTTNIPGLTYTIGTAGLPLQYTGSAPDIGAVEYQ